MVNTTQESIILQVRKDLGPGETTEILIDWLLDAWQTFEALQDCFGEVKALQIYTASVRFPSNLSVETLPRECLLSPC